MGNTNGRNEGNPRTMVRVLTSNRSIQLRNEQIGDNIETKSIDSWHEKRSMYRILVEWK